MKRKFYLFLFISSASLCLAFPVFAQDSQNDTQESPPQLPAINDEWQFTLAPLYIWFAGIEGKSSIGPVTAPLDVSFKDVLDNLDTVFTFHLEARKQKFNLFADYMLLDISPQLSTSVGIPVNTNVHNNIVEFGGGYLVREAYPSVELLAGVRYTNLEISASPVPPINVDENWWDGYGGLRLIQELGDNSGWSLVGKADVGGGGSDLTWSALVAVDWKYKTWGSVRAGYKWLGYDLDTGTGPGRFSYDVVYQGPIVGMVFYW